MRIGFIGAGNMATALMEGMILGGALPETFVALDVSEARAAAMRAMGVPIAKHISDLAAQVDIAVLAVKPIVAADVCRQLSACAGLPDVLSIVGSFPQRALEAALPGARGIARAMPNTPARVGAGVIALNENHTVDAERFDRMSEAFARCGQVMVVPERLMGAVTAVSGSGPAYAYLFIEALADAGVREGISREMAYRLAAQTVLGAAQMVRDTGSHPAALKDAVASPGGTTIEAIYALEKAGLRAAVMDAVDACARKVEAMEKREGHS